MAYEATDWMCGDTVTAEKLNKLERGVQDIMSDYVPTVWECGDVITAEKLNKLEQAVADFEGGGSSDFSTAEVTVVNNTNTGVNILGAIIDHDVINGGMIMADNDTHAIEAVLYKAEGLIIVDDEEATITVSGDAELDETSVIITGDCTITIS